MAELGEMLKTYKIEIGNMETLAKNRRDEEAQLEMEYNQLDDNADALENQATLLEVEASDLEREMNVTQSYF